MGVAGDRSVKEGELGTQILSVLLFRGCGGSMCPKSCYLPPPVSLGFHPGLGASGLGIFRLSCLEQ
jgi:hypothetical protein